MAVETSTPSFNPAIILSPDRAVKKVQVSIDYTIIEHFSNHLYGSPYKAIEELVVNGFDAFATDVRVFIDGPKTPNRIVIWDNGLSMDVDGIELMWHLSKSPKRNNRVISQGGQSRSVIGKFGIGKVASYTLGSSISHICKQDGRYLAIRMDYERLMQPQETEASASNELQVVAPVSISEGVNDQVLDELLQQVNVDVNKQPERKEVDIYELTEEEARDIVLSLFSEVPEKLESWLAEPHWTVAVIEGLKGKQVSQRRLEWILGNAMPLRPDFAVSVECKAVLPSLEKTDVVRRGDFSDVSLVEDLKIKWNEAATHRKVLGELKFGTKKGLDPNNPEAVIPFVDFPTLGRVWGKVTLYKDSFKSLNESDEQRSYGFFIMVLGRLINDNNPNFLLSDPSFGTFYRAQYVLHVDGLDAELLADRERVHRDTVMATEMALLQRSIYLTSTNWKAIHDQQTAKEASIIGSLPLFSREHYVEPLTALRFKYVQQENQDFDLKNPRIDFREKSSSDTVASIEPDGSALTVNTAHPYYRSLAQTFGVSSERSRKILREFERVAISELFFEGYLHSIGLEDHIVNEITDWRDKQYRLLALTKPDSLHALAEELRRAASKSTGKDFEIAIAAMLNAMGFVAERNGASSEEDVIMTAPCGKDSYTFTFEAKAKLNGELENDKAELDIAAAHRKKVGAEHVVVIARRFAGFTKKPDGWPMILQQCEAVPGVSIMETEALIRLAEVMNRYSYSLAHAKSILTKIEPPAQKMAAIEALGDPFTHFDYHTLLNKLWRDQLDLGAKEMISYRTIWQKNYRKVMTLTELEQKLEALEMLGSPLITFDKGKELVSLHQSPTHVLRLIQSRVDQSPSEKGDE